MIALQIAIVAFIVMELSNVVIMYFKPQFKYGNSMNSFVAYEESKEDDATHLFVKYMVNWVANCKLIFIVMLGVVAIIGDIIIMRYAVGATIGSIGIYFVSLFPIIRKLDRLGKINPKGYSKTLTLMIIGFMLMFGVALALSFVV